jgi:hypothetical protein
VTTGGAVRPSPASFAPFGRSAGVNTRTPILGLAAAAVLLAGCTSGGYYHQRFAQSGVDYAGFYDDYYGPVADGYWGADGFFRYRDSLGHPFQRDDGQHFRHDAAPNFHPMHGHHEGATDDGAQ